MFRTFMEFSPVVGARVHLPQRFVPSGHKVVVDVETPYGAFTAVAESTWVRDGDDRLRVISVKRNIPLSQRS